MGISEIMGKTGIVWTRSSSANAQVDSRALKGQQGPAFEPSHDVVYVTEHSDDDQAS